MIFIYLFRPKIRQRLDPLKIDYFINWIVESDLLISIPWGSTNLKLNNGEIITIPHQILQAKHSQIVYFYKQHCNEVGIDPMSDRKVYSILENIRANQQKVVSGVDDFVKDASEGWENLKNLIQQLPISRSDKNELDIKLENSKMYLKIKYASHCDENEQSPTHCTIHALSDTNDSSYSQSCDHKHEEFCEGINHRDFFLPTPNKFLNYYLDCMSIFQLFDKIKNYIDYVNDQEMKEELLYDFKLIWNSIFEFMAHKIRAKQQEHEKKKYLDELDYSTAFLTVDWSQKILPQEFREGQSSYYGKKGMSLLVGSFAFKPVARGKKIKQFYNKY